MRAPANGTSRTAQSVSAFSHAAAEDARKNCPDSQALAGVPEITLDAQLAS